jgi:GT2 family glycosyltransferase
MTLDARITAVVLTHNRVGGALQTLDRLSALPERPPLIVVDNGSQDGTAEAVARSFPQVKLVRLNRNIGAAARNAGIRAADSPYLALCDDDTWWEAGSLSRAADLLDRHPRLAVITAKVLVGVEKREDPTSREMASSPLRPATGVGTPILGFLAGASVIRRSAFLEVGGFEPRLFMGGEEALVAIDLASAGWQMAYVESLIVHHHPSPQRDASLRRQLLLRNAVWVAWLRRPVVSAARQSLRLIRARSSDLPLFSTLGQIIGGLFWILRRRKVVPAEVESQIQQLEAA